MSPSVYWNAVNGMTVRGVSLMYWPEEIHLKDRIVTVVSMVSALDLWPVRVEIGVEQMRKSKVRNWRTANDANFDEFPSVRGVSFLSSLPATKGDMDAHLRSLHITCEWRWLYFEGGSSFLDVSSALGIVGQFLQIATPRFGFSDIGLKGETHAFHRGYPISGMSNDQVARAYAYQAVNLCRQDDPNFLGRRLLDIYEMNILNSEHLRMRVFGLSLEDWIAQGSRGTLLELKRDVFAWTVPAEIRTAIRKEFLMQGYLVVPV